MSLRPRLLIALLPLFAVALVVADAGTYIALRSFLLTRVDDQLVQGHVAFEQRIEQQAGLTPGGPRGPGGPRDGGGPGGPISLPGGTDGVLLTPSGAVVGSPYVVGGSDDSSVSSRAHPVLPAKLPSVTPQQHRLFTVPGAQGSATTACTRRSPVTV
jgi:two-component system OmpR family sensor kinase